MYRVVAYFNNKDSDMLTVHYVQLHSYWRKEYIFFGKYVGHIVLDLTSVDPKPMSKEDAELTAKIAYLTLRFNNLNRIELEEV